MKSSSRFPLFALLSVLCILYYNTSAQSKIVLVFNNIPHYKRTISPIPNIKLSDDRQQISVYDNYYKYDFNPDALVIDTITFIPKGKSIVLTFLYETTREPIYYLINVGDTVNFSFKNGIPYVEGGDKSKHRNSLNYEYERLVANGGLENHTPYDIYMNPIVKAKSIIDAANSATIQHKWYALAREFLKKEDKLLNNFKLFNKTDSIVLAFFKDKLNYQIATIDFEQGQLSSDSLNAMFLEINQKGINTPYSLSLPFLETVSNTFNVRVAKIIKSKNGSEVDYRDVYDRTSKWTSVNRFYKKHLHYSYLRKIGIMFSRSDLQNYLHKFDLTYGDTLLVDRIKEEFIIMDGETPMGTDSLFLLNRENSKLSFEDFLIVNKGKVIYIDFWASWCAPCRDEMNSAKQLREEFSNKNIVFAYFSIDKNRDKWMRASIEEALNTVTYNYILLNSETSSFFKSIDLNAIPRYLIYDKNGILVYKKAPAPGTDDIRKILFEYIDE